MNKGRERDGAGGGSGRSGAGVGLHVFFALVAGSQRGGGAGGAHEGDQDKEDRQDAGHGLEPRSKNVREYAENEMRDEPDNTEHGREAGSREQCNTDNDQDLTSHRAHLEDRRLRGSCIGDPLELGGTITPAHNDRQVRGEIRFETIEGKTGARATKIGVEYDHGQ